MHRLRQRRERCEEEADEPEVHLRAGVCQVSDMRTGTCRRPTRRRRDLGCRGEADACDQEQQRPEPHRRGALAEEDGADARGEERLQRLHDLRERHRRVEQGCSVCNESNHERHGDGHDPPGVALQVEPSASGDAEVED